MTLSNLNEHQLRAEAFATLLKGLQPYLQAPSRELADTLLRVGELRIAGEMICDWLAEDEVALPAPLHAELMQMLAAVGVEELYVRFVPEARMNPRWSKDTEEALRSAGWFPERRVDELVGPWRHALEDGGGFRMSAAAHEALLQFGGIRARRSGPGRSHARGGFDLDPLRAVGEEERFLNTGLALFPLGEADDGHAFLGIAPDGAVYLVSHVARRLGDDVPTALNAILEGVKAE